MDNSKINQEIVSAFGLDIPPIAMAFVDNQPQGVENYGGGGSILLYFLAHGREKNHSMPRQINIITVQ